jgi:hypothetical protein
MRRFCALNAFDAVINLYTAFGYFEEQADDKRVLLNAFASLKKGGKLLIQTMSKEVLARIFQPRDWHETDGVKFLRESKVTQDWSWVENRWIFLNGEGQKEFKFSHRLYSAVELTDLLKKTGFRKVNAYGDLTGVPYDHEAKYLIIVAEK